jgi:hypothetical protein
VLGFHLSLQIIDAIFEQDPNGATLAFADMMKKQIVMPAHLMDDGSHETTNKGRNLFAVSGTLGWVLPAAVMHVLCWPGCTAVHAACATLGCCHRGMPPCLPCAERMCCFSPIFLQDFSSVAEKTGTYTAFDYADIMEHLGKRWKLADRSDLTGEVSSRARRAEHGSKVVL